MYTLEDVYAAEARIRSEVPDVVTGRDDYDWTLVAQSPDKSLSFIVFQHNDYGAIFYGDVDRIIKELKQHSDDNVIRTYDPATPHVDRMQR
jgi:hypothetical protein